MPSQPKPPAIEEVFHAAFEYTKETFIDTWGRRSRTGQSLVEADVCFDFWGGNIACHSFADLIALHIISIFEKDLFSTINRFMLVYEHLLYARIF